METLDSHQTFSVLNSCLMLYPYLILSCLCYPTLLQSPTQQIQKRVPDCSLLAMVESARMETVPFCCCSLLSDHDIIISL